MIKVNVRKWSKSMLFTVSMITIHVFIILYSLYQSLFSFDLYPALGLLTYSLLSVGMHFSVLLLLMNRYQYSSLFLVLAVLASAIIYSDVYLPGILLTSWRYSSFIAISICCFSFLIHLGSKRNGLENITYWLIIGLWILLSLILLFAISSTFVYKIGLAALVVCSVLLIVQSILKIRSSSH